VVPQQDATSQIVEPVQMMPKETLFVVGVFKAISLTDKAAYPANFHVNHVHLIEL
jgi:hypothetical protein